MFVHNRVTKSAESNELIYLKPSLRHTFEDLSSIFSALESEDEVIVGVAPAPERLIEGYGLVSVINGEIEGLPGRANEALRSVILESAVPPGAKNSKERLSSATAEVQRFPKLAGDMDALFEQADLLLDGGDHKNVLTRLLKKARDHVVIHSTFISPEGWQAILPKMLEATAVGATIQVFWGQTDDQNDMSSSRLRPLCSEPPSLKRAVLDQIIVHPFPTNLAPPRYF